MDGLFRFVPPDLHACFAAAATNESSARHRGYGGFQVVNVSEGL